jgi:N-acetylneuraminate synthase
MLDFNNLDQVYSIAEIGINHNGDVGIAKRLIDAAFACGWDCVKFQKRQPDICVPEHQKNVMRDTPWGRLRYIDYRKRIEFGGAEYDQIDAYCDQKPISWTGSVWDLPSLEFLLRYDVPLLKIPSAHITNLELVTEVARSGQPVVASSGMSTMEELEACVDTIKKHCSNYVILHCNASYPAPEDEVNIRTIQTLKEHFECPIGYSGHEYGLEPTVLAVALGAMVIERHITLDHDMWGTDQKSSIEIEGMDKLIRRIRAIPTILGTAEKTVTPSEQTIRRKLRG